MAYVLDKNTGTFVEVKSAEVVNEEKSKAAEESDNQIDLLKLEKKDEPTVVPANDNEPTETFRRMSDLSVMQIVDQSNGKVMAVIAGYGLQIKFNLEAITETADVEQCAEGLKKLFYNIIMDQILGGR
jgi:hypothetical protein